jgi:hypothetical protein
MAIASNGRTDECGKYEYLEGSGHGLIETLPQDLPGGTEENPRKDLPR